MQYHCISGGSRSPVINAASASKTITSGNSGTFYSGTMRYSFSASATLSYNTSTGKVSSASSLAITGATCNTSLLSGPSCTIVPKETSKTISGKNVVYGVSVRRTAAGVYSDTINVNLYFSSPINNRSLLQTNEVKIEVSEPYDIIYYDGDE